MKTFAVLAFNQRPSLQGLMGGNHQIFADAVRGMQRQCSMVCIHTNDNHVLQHKCNTWAARQWRECTRSLLNTHFILHRCEAGRAVRAQTRGTAKPVSCLQEWLIAHTYRRVEDWVNLRGIISQNNLPTTSGFWFWTYLRQR